MNDTPPPLPAMSRTSNVFANGASLACLLAPVLLGVLGVGFHFVSPVLAGRTLGIAMLVFGGVSCLLLAAGPIMGILALLLMKPGGRSRIVVCSLGGLVLTSALIAIAVPKYVRARTAAVTQKAAVENMIAATKDLNKKEAELLKTNGPPASINQPAQAPGQTAPSAPDEDGLKKQAKQAYLARLQEVQRAYQAAWSSLTTARVLSTSNLVARGDIEERKAVVQNFLKCNEAVKNFTIQSEDNYRGELVQLNVSPAVVESAVEEFHRTSVPRLPVIIEISAQNERIGAGMLEVLDLLDANWGRWSYNQDNGHVRFESQDLVEEYNTDLKGINEAGTEQISLQKHLATVMSQASLR